MKYEFISEHQTEFSTNVMCDVLGVSYSGYHAWRSRPVSARDIENKYVVERLKHYHQLSRKTYGIIRLQDDLRDEGININRKRISRLKRENDIYPKQRKRFVTTTDSRHENPIADNVLQRKFNPEEKDAVWVSDITYLPLKTGWIYLATIIDLYSRRVIGWQLASHMRTELILDAFEAAKVTRFGQSPSLFHSDRGVQYTSGDFQLRLNENETEMSMSRKGNCWDNSVAESFFATLKREWLDGKEFNAIDDLRISLFDYIEVFYNRQRKHSSNGYISPVKFEEMELVIAA